MTGRRVPVRIAMFREGKVEDLLNRILEKGYNDQK